LCYEEGVKSPGVTNIGPSVKLDCLISPACVRGGTSPEMKRKCLSLLAVALLASCASAPQLATLATSDNVQTTIKVLGSLALPKVAASDKAVVHQFATDLLSLAAANVDSTTIAALTAKIPAKVSPYVTSLIAASTTSLNLALAKFGSHNATVLAYVNAVGNGLLQAGF
jgi:hypothetical protein